MTLNDQTWLLLNKSRRVLFHHLGEGKVIIEPYSTDAPHKVFDVLVAAEILMLSRHAWLVGGKTAMCRTPRFLIDLEVSPGVTIGKVVLGVGLYFDFGISSLVEELTLDMVIAKSKTHENYSIPLFEQAFMRLRRSKERRQLPKKIVDKKQVDFPDSLELNAPIVPVSRRRVR